MIKESYVYLTLVLKQIQAQQNRLLFGEREKFSIAKVQQGGYRQPDRFRAVEQIPTATTDIRYAE